MVLDDDEVHPDFARFYNYDSLTGKKASKLLHSVNSLVFFLQNELEDLGTDYLDYILIPLLGTNCNRVNFCLPIACAIGNILFSNGYP